MTNGHWTLNPHLTVSDLARRARSDSETLLSIRLPVRLIDQLDGVCRKLGARKSEVVVALINEGLDRLAEKRAKRPSRKK